MKLIIYTLTSCKICEDRQKAHNAIASILEEADIDTQGIVFGKIDGRTYLPLDEHDSLCRKVGDPTKYAAPVYILEDENNTVKLMEYEVEYKTPESYCAYVERVADSLDQ